MAIAAGHYCDKNDVYDLTNLDEDTIPISKIGKIIGIAQTEIEARLKAAGYPTEDWSTNALTPPKIQVLCCKLATGYALRNQYTGESPNETKQGERWVKDAMRQLDAIAEGDEDLVDVDGEIVEPDAEKSGLPLKTTDVKGVFDLDDNPDISDYIKDGTYEGEDED